MTPPRALDGMLLVGRAVIAAVLIATLGGIRSAWMPGAGWLALGLVVLHAAASARIGRLRECARVLRAHPFAVAMALTVVLALVVRFPGYVSDLRNAPLDIDEN